VVFANSEENIKRALERMDKVLRKLL